MTTAQDFSQLRVLAEAANIIDHNENAEWYDSEGLLEFGFGYPKNTRFIAAASPATIITLLDAMEALQAEVAQLESQNRTFTKIYDAEHEEFVRLGERHNAALVRLAAMEASHCGIKDLRDYMWLDPQCAGGGCQSLVIAAGASPGEPAKPFVMGGPQARERMLQEQIPKHEGLLLNATQPRQAREFFRSGCKECDRQKQVDADKKQWQGGIKRGSEIVKAMAESINAKGDAS